MKKRILKNKKLYLKLWYKKNKYMILLTIIIDNIILLGIIWKY